MNQPLKGAGGGWHTKYEEWCEDHKVQIPKNPEAHVENRQGFELVRMKYCLNLILWDIQTRSQG